VVDTTGIRFSGVYGATTPSQGVKMSKLDHLLDSYYNARYVKEDDQRSLAAGVFDMAKAHEDIAAYVEGAEREAERLTWDTANAMWVETLRNKLLRLLGVAKEYGSAEVEKSLYDELAAAKQHRVRARDAINAKFEEALGEDADNGMRIKGIPTGHDLKWQHNGWNARSQEARKRWYGKEQS
jgi:hypothetical protein